MRGYLSVRRKRAPSRSAAIAAAGLLLLTVIAAPAVMAAPPHPSPGSATIDGSIGDWSLGDDFFANMTDAGKPDADVRAKLYLKYDCDEEVLYALVLVQGEEKARQDRPDEAYLRIDGSGKLISPSGDFAWVNGDGTLADGWEGAGSLAPGTYTLRAHVLVADDSADGYTPMDPVGREVPLVIECEEPTPPTPTPSSSVAPTQSTNPTAPPTGNVNPTTGTSVDPTLPPTDTLESAQPAGPTSGVALVLLMLAISAVASLVATYTARRRTVTVKESIERR